MILDVRLIPNASPDGIAGKRGQEIVLRVGAPAVDGKANRAAIRCLAKLFGVSRSKVQLVRGEKSRHKKFEIVGLKPGLAAKTLSGLLDSI